MDAEKNGCMVDPGETTEQGHRSHLLSQEEHETSKWQAIKRNPTAFAWCIFAVWTILLVSFENQASGNVLGIPKFRKDFGYAFEGDYVLPAKWQSAFSGGSVASYIESYPLLRWLFMANTVSQAGCWGFGCCSDCRLD